MIYLNNAATSYPKPPMVVKAVTEALDDVPVSSLRSSLPSNDLLTELRKQLGRLLHISDWERIFFASGATDATNRVLGGISIKDIEVLTNNHNSVLRPVANGIKAHSDGKYRIVAINHCSNVTGAIADVKKLCREAHEKGQLLLLDAAQSAGCIPIDVDEWGVDMLVFTGHKALFGPMGTGGYYVRRGIELRPTLFGGTGRDSSVIDYQDEDWEYEVGTQNMPGLAGMKAGVEYVLKQGVEQIFHKEQELTNHFISQLSSIPHVTLYSNGGEWQGPVVSFNIEGLHPSDVGYILQNSYDITVRTGLHCAPLIHQELNTSPYGTVRVSLSDFTTHDDIEQLTQAIREISHSI